MIPIVQDGQILLKPDAGSNAVLAALSTSAAAKLMDDLRACLDSSDAQAAQQCDGLIYALTQEFHKRADPVRGKKPWEMSATHWDDLHQPIAWLREESAEVPRYLATLITRGRSRLQVTRAIEHCFVSCMGYEPYGSRRPGFLVDKRHIAHVAFALRRGLSIPGWVLASYPPETWIREKFSWVLRYLDKQHWAATLAGRLVTSAEADRLIRFADRNWHGESRAHPLQDSAQYYDAWTPHEVNTLLAKERIAA